MKINFIYDPNVSLEQMLGFEIASLIWSKLFADDITVNLLATGSNDLNENVIGGAIPELHEQHYGLFLQYFEADITSEEDRLAYDYLQQGNTVDFLLNGEVVSGNTKIKLTTALAKALGMDEAISIDRYVLDEEANPIDGTILMNQNFNWDYNYLRDEIGGENSLDFLSVALHEVGHILGFVSSLDYSLEKDTLYSGRTELNNFSPLDLFRFSAESMAVDNPDGAVNDLSVGGVAWFSTDGGETVSAKMSTGKEGDGFQASHWERRYNPMGIMDPTLWYQERVSISDLDLLAFDIIGYDLSEEADNVDSFFSEEGLEVFLAEAKVQLSHKLGVSVDWLENNTDVPDSDDDLIAQIQEGATFHTVEMPNIDVSRSSESVPEEEHEAIKELDGMMKDMYQWWSSSRGRKAASFQELYEWWASSRSQKAKSFQELYEWWFQSRGRKAASFQELYEWWFQSRGRKGVSFQEIEQWHQEDTSGEYSWWQSVLVSSQEENNNYNIALPGSSFEPSEKELVGGAEDDIIGGDETNNHIFAAKGDDLIDGASGHDTIFGGDGYDTIFGFDGKDLIIGGQGDDVISGESDEDVLLGQGGDDVLMGGEHDDYLDGGQGRDFLVGETGHDALIGGDGDDALEGESGKDLLVGGEGRDIGNGGTGDDFIFGDDYSDSLSKAFGNNISPLTDSFDFAEEPNSTTSTETNDPEVSEEENTSSNSEVETNEVVLANDSQEFVSSDTIRIEAESMKLSGGYSVEDKKQIRTYETNNFSTASTVFDGDSGYYKVVVNYIDRSDSNASAKVSINNQEIDNWIFDKNTETITTRRWWWTTTTHTSKYLNHTVSEGMYIDTNDIIEIQGKAQNQEKAQIDWIELIPVKPPENNDSENAIRIEAEDMTLSGSYQLEIDNYNGNVIGTKNTDSSSGGLLFPSQDSNTSQSGLATTTFNGEFGYYDVVVRYVDESDGNASLKVKIGNDEIDDWVLNENTDGNDENKLRTIAEQIQIKPNDVIEILGSSHGGESALVDYIEFIPTEKPYFDPGENTDILKGGVGNDAIDGGKGNDMIFGEDESNDSSKAEIGGDDTVFGGVGNDMVYGNSGNDLIFGHYLDYETAKHQRTLTFQEGVNGYNNTVDTTLNQDRSNSSYGSETTLNTGIDQSLLSSEQNQVLIRFDNIFGSESGQIGSDLQIESAILEIDVTDPGSTFSVHQMFTDWSEASTWNSMGNGIQTVTEASAPITYVQPNTQGKIQIDLTSSLKAWQEDPSTNHGWALIPQGNDSVVFSSSEAVTTEESSTSSSGLLGGLVGGLFGLGSSQSTTSTGVAPRLKVNTIQEATYNGSNYLVTDSVMTWKEAQAYAETIGGNLVTINNAEEYEWLKDTFGTSDQFWTGFTDTETEGTWKWVSGEGSEWILGEANEGIFTDWAKDNPSNTFEAQHYGTMNYNSEGQWDDASFLHQFIGLIEVKIAEADNDRLIGNGGNDTLNGGIGNDLLNGTDEIVAGLYELDVLKGDAGADTFVLGDTTQPYYATGGLEDYVVIQDFDGEVDTIQLHGSIGEYSYSQDVVSGNNGVSVYHQGDLIAILENNNTFNLDSNVDYI